MTPNPRAETLPPAKPVPCGTCRNPIALTDTGWTHLTPHGVPETGWLCPLPHVHLADPSPPRPAPRRVTPIPPMHRPTAPAVDKPPRHAAP